MPVFPDYYSKLNEDPKIGPDDGAIFDRSDGGTVRARIMYVDTRYEIEFTLAPMTEAEYSVIMAFYQANKTADDVTFELAGGMYEGVFTRPPYAKRNANGILEVDISADCILL